MSIDTLMQRGSIRIGLVGDAAGQSLQYAMMGEYREEHEPVQEDGLSGIAYERITIRTRVVAVAPTMEEIQQTVATTCTDLTRRGQTVTIIERGGADRVLAPQGGASGAVRGYPIVTCIQDRSRGNGKFLEFALSIETLVPRPASTVSGYNLVQHSWKMTLGEDADENDLTSRSGTVRVRNDQSAQNYIQSQILGPAKSARPAGSPWEQEIEISDDASIASYTYSIGAPNGSSGGGSVTNSETTITVDARTEGLRTRKISGYALGTGAAAFAASKRPSGSSTSVLRSESVSEPRDPDGRVDFSFELVTGADGDDYDFPAGSVIHQYRESLREVGGGRSMAAVEFGEVAPILLMGDLRAYGYEQTIELQWRNATLAAMVASSPCSIPTGFAADDLVDELRPEAVMDQGILRTTIRRVFLKTARVTLPAPREVSTL